MMKKLSYALLGTTLLGAAAHAEEAASFSAAPVAAPCNFSGAYVGLTFGMGLTKHGKFLQEQNVAGAETPSPEQNPLASGFAGGIFAGYGKEFASRFYAGLELSYLMDIAKVKALDTAPDETVELKKKDTFEAAVRLGLAMNNVLPYIKVGFANSKFQTKFENGENPAKVFNQSKRLNGFVVGAGIDMKVSPKLMAGLGYTYTAYKKLKGKDVTPDGGDVVADNYLRNGYKPTSHNIMLRVAYTF